MSDFGRKLKECREAKKMSQSGFAKEIGVHHSIIGKYERDEVKPTIDVIVKIAKILNTTVGYLLGEEQDKNALKDPQMIKRINELYNLPKNDQNCILYAFDGLIRDAKARQTYTQ